jgi:hypothetical protein
VTLFWFPDLKVLNGIMKEYCVHMGDTNAKGGKEYIYIYIFFFLDFGEYLSDGMEREIY